MNGFNFEMEVESERDEDGNNYCSYWDGEFLKIGRPSGKNNDWQLVIYGLYDDDFMSLGIKRNTIITGPSSKYFQVVAKPLDQYLLSGLIDEAKRQNRFDIADVLSKISKDSPSVETIKKMLTAVEKNADE